MINLFHDLPEHQRTWFTDYYKLRAVWQVLGHPLEEFPRLRDGPIREPYPWKTRDHPLNRSLELARETVEGEYGPHWRRYQDYQVSYAVLDEHGMVEFFEPDYREIKVKGFRKCPECVCDKCYRHGLCGLGCTNPKRNSENNEVI